MNYALTFAILLFTLVAFGQNAEDYYIPTYPKNRAIYVPYDEGTTNLIRVKTFVKLNSYKGYHTVYKISEAEVLGGIKTEMTEYVIALKQKEVILLSSVIFESGIKQQKLEFNEEKVIFKVPIGDEHLKWESINLKGEKMFYEVYSSYVQMGSKRRHVLAIKSHKVTEPNYVHVSLYEKGRGQWVNNLEISGKIHNVDYLEQLSIDPNLK